MFEELRYKAGIQQAVERHRAFWHHEIIDRACIAVSALQPHQVPLPQPEHDGQYTETWQANTDAGYLVRLINAQMENTWYGGEALPVAYAPGNLLYAAYGGQASISAGTVWVDPVIHDAEAWRRYRFDPENPYILDVIRLTRALAEDAPGKYLVGSPGVFGPMDAMSMMRGMCEFLMELALPGCRESIEAAHREMICGFLYISEQIYGAAGSYLGGALNYPGLWAPGPINNWSADFIYNIGPRHFEQCVLPEMRALASMMAYNMYHLDGFNAVVHLPMILAIPEIKGIQFTPGFGHSLAEALPVYKRIQQGGKVQYVHCLYDEVGHVLDELDPRGLLIYTSAPSIDAGEALLKEAARRSSTAHLAYTRRRG